MARNNNKNQRIYAVHGADKKNLRRINIVVTAQTLGHLESMAAANGWGEKDLGRVVDKLVRTAVVEHRHSADKK
jgi:hypothetical protein